METYRKQTPVAECLSFLSGSGHDKNIIAMP